jgi:DNA modification methylase
MNKVYFGDFRDFLKKMKEEGIKVQTCITSPPYRSIKNKPNTFYSKELMEKHANRICYCHEYIGS